MKNIKSTYVIDYFTKDNSDSEFLTNDIIKSALLKENAVGFVVISDSFEILSYSELFVHLLQYQSPEEFNGQSPYSYLELIYPEDKELVKKYLADCIQSSIEYRLLTKNDDLIWVEGHFTPLENHSNCFIHTVKQIDFMSKERLNRIQNFEKYKETLGLGVRIAYEFDVTEDQIYKGITDFDHSNVLYTIGLPIPCKYTDYCKKWEDYVASHSLDEYKKYNNLAFLLDAYEQGITTISCKYETKTHKGEICWIKKTIVLSKNPYNGNIIGQVYLVDFTKEKNLELQSDLVYSDFNCNPASH